MNFKHILSHSALVLKKYSPEILTGVGIGLSVGGTVLACKATLKFEDVVAKEFHENKENQAKVNTMVDEGRLEKENYTDFDRASDTAQIYALAFGKTVRLYAPAIGLGVAGIALILSGHHILSQRNAAIATAYAAVQEAYTKYRARVVEDLGADKDMEFQHGLVDDVKTDIDENGESDFVKIEGYDPNGISPYAVFFDKLSSHWEDEPGRNRMFLQAQQNYANDLLKSRGHIFLNEIYDMLDVPRTTAGQVVGWVYDPEKSESDTFVDFGLFNPLNEMAHEFVNGYETSILLDFNVDGVVYDLI